MRINAILLQRAGSPTAIHLPSTKPESLSTHPSAAIQINQTVSSADIPSQMRPAPQTVIIPAPTIPQYSGTPSEKSLQFLLRLQHFASSMYGWTDTVLLRDVPEPGTEELSAELSQLLPGRN
ncbi:unnamed protein product [Didymodactylos carnosus]|uniref:Uncharacterized protein n=1 Tax=Didymodactylos carnosus TaxID=1234261 RepID=A0A815SX65_9BILA|nr:unnamed protein product [Didymodactylos carnosus]CAF4361448.1 unnamed protein product [Didymodactylos carnosus]